jgi:hypothetical protein
LAGEAVMVVYRRRRIKMARGHGRGVGAGRSFVTAPVTSSRSNHTPPQSTHRWQHFPDVVKESRSRGGFPPECANRGDQGQAEGIPIGYSAALTRVAPGGFAFFQSPGARTLLADRISMPTMWPSASTSYFRPVYLAAPNGDVHRVGLRIVSYVSHGFRLAFRSNIALV